MKNNKHLFGIYMTLKREKVTDKLGIQSFLVDLLISDWSLV